MHLNYEFSLYCGNCCTVVLKGTEERNKQGWSLCPNCRHKLRTHNNHKRPKDKEGLKRI